MHEVGPHILNSGALLPTPIFFLGQLLIGIQYMDLSGCIFYTWKSLLPGCEAIHCGGVEPARDLHTLVVVFFVCLVLLHAQEAVTCYCIRAAFVSKLSNIHTVLF